MREHREASKDKGSNYVYYLALGRQIQVYFGNFKANLIYRVNSRPARPT